MTSVLDETPAANTQNGESTRVCVVGAGPSGLAVAKALAQIGIAYDCYEAKSAIGGLWAGIEDGTPGCGYESLHSNTSKSVMEFPSYPMPEGFPDYPHHSQIAEYLQTFANELGLAENIRLETPVTAIERETDGSWLVQAGGQATSYQAVIVASGGRHGRPKSIRIDGDFTGTEIHSFDYSNPEQFVGKRVLVVGLGATSADIAVEIARVADTTDLAVRTGHYVVPKLFSGKPIDETSPIVERLSVERRRPLIKLLLALTHGPMSNYGLPDPPYGPGEAPLIASSDLLVAIKQGQLTARPEPVHVSDDMVTFADNTTGQFDSIVYCTGYDIDFPFLKNVMDISPTDSPSLYRHIAHPETPGLFFAGLVHSTTALMPVAEAQAEWIAELIGGEAVLPPPEAMWQTIRTDRRKQESRFYNTSMHLLEDLHEYTRQIGHERTRTNSLAAPAKGRRKFRKQGHKRQ